MGYQAKFEKGGTSIDLTTGGYSIMPDFVPPSTEVNSNIAFGSAISSGMGGEVVSKSAAHIEFHFTVRVMGGSDAEMGSLISKLAWYISQNDDPAEPLYFCYRPDANYDFEPLWGQFGAFRRLEVLGASVSRVGAYASPVKEKAQQVTVSLFVKPYALGKRQRLAYATGCVLENVYGSPDGPSRGLVMSSVGNKFTNPIFAHTTPLNGWNTGADLVSSSSIEDKTVIFGQYSAKITRVTGGANQGFYQSINAGNTNPHTLSCYARAQDRGVITSNDLVLRYDVSLTTTYRPLGNGWYLSDRDGERDRQLAGEEGAKRGWWPNRKV